MKNFFSKKVLSLTKLCEFYKQPNIVCCKTTTFLACRKLRAVSYKTFHTFIEMALAMRFLKHTVLKTSF